MFSYESQTESGTFNHFGFEPEPDRYLGALYCGANAGSGGADEDDADALGDGPPYVSDPPTG